jgi:FkbM family methyltransferase
VPVLSNAFQVVDGRYGRILIPPADRYVGRSMVEYGEFSQAEVDLFDALIQPGMVVADLGANYGTHTLFFAKKASLVYAVEPQRMVYNALCGTLALNTLFNVVPIHGAVGAEDGTVACADVNFDSPELNAGALSIPEIPEAFRTYTVPKFRFTSPCHFMKIDVEGMEEEAIVGAADMIRECKPLIYCENDRKSKSESLIACLKDLGYKSFWHATPLYNPDNIRKNKVNIFGEVWSLNMLSLPKEVEFEGLPPAIEPFHPDYTYTHG